MLPIFGSKLQLFGEREKWIPAIWRLKNVVHNCLLDIWKWKNLVPIRRRKEKDYDIYLKSEKLVHSNQEHEKKLASYLEVEKSGSQLFRA